MLTFSNQYSTQSTAEVDGNVISFAGIWSKAKVSKELKVSRIHPFGDHKGLYNNYWQSIQ